MFQSLKGIWVNFDGQEASIKNWHSQVSIPKRDLGEFRLDSVHPKTRYQEFQSLKGIWVNFDADIQVERSPRSKFQSLKGIWVNFDFGGMDARLPARSNVSIPKRDLGEFRLLHSSNQRCREARFNP